MTKLLDKAIEAVRGLTPEEQDKIAEMILAMAEGEEDEEDIDPEDLEAIKRGLDDMKNGRFATDEQVEAAYGKFGRLNRKGHVS